MGKLDLSVVPPNRLLALARYANTAWAQTIRRMVQHRRIATLVAFVRVLESTACDDILDLLDTLISDLISNANRQGEKERLRTIKDLDAAALQLGEACWFLLDPTTNNSEVRDAVFARISKQELAFALDRVMALARPPDDNYYELMLLRWRYVWLFFPKLLQVINFEGNESGLATIEAIEFLKTIVGQRKPDMNLAPLAVVSKSWLVLVIGDGGAINYKAYSTLR